MADLHVQPKKSSSILPWILGLLALIALIYFLTKGCNKADTVATTNDSTSTTTTTNTTTAPLAGAAGGYWDSVDFNAPTVNYGEISDTSIQVRGNDQVGIYGMGENVLFDSDKSTIRPQAENNLRQIVASINQRYKGGEVRVYGYTDAKGSASYNQQLAEERARAVRDWLTQNGNLGEGRISLHPVGEARPVASNATEEGRQQNRRVEVVARKAS